MVRQPDRIKAAFLDRAVTSEEYVARYSDGRWTVDRSPKPSAGA